MKYPAAYTNAKKPAEVLADNAFVNTNIDLDNPAQELQDNPELIAQLDCTN